jgi:hypothetical protein
MTRALSIWFIVVLVWGLSSPAFADCTPGYARYLENKGKMQKLLSESSANANLPTYRDLESKNLGYRFCVSALAFQVVRLAESKEFAVLSRYLESRSAEQDPAFRSLRAWARYTQDPKHGLNDIKDFFASFDSARQILFEMNEVLFREFGVDGKTLPRVLKSHGAFSALYTDILTKHYSSDPAIAGVFDRLIAQQDIGFEYRHEYASYVRKNIPNYQRYANLKEFVAAASK